ncbi:hypothetical protein BGZ72_000729 [Mortierella alpina]|nr:hypothetical protein BGZ72_000729 [Mortierella alpina]
MQSVGSFFSTVSKFYNELNPATLSGAIDVVVVEQADGELACSPFHVRFGKLSILRPQEKVVEVTINGRVVDFPMKVGDAGEAFFVFETEQDVPEEFATSPLAGPTTDKAEEDIDYLDLAQGNSTVAHPPDDIDTGYVSAHSGHGSEFEEEERADLSPDLDKPPDYASAARDIMENFQPIDSAGPFDDSREHAEHLPVPGSISADMGGYSGFLTHPRDDMIMDMTGYKTEDSAETDLESDASSERETTTAGASNGRLRHPSEKDTLSPTPAILRRFPSKNLNFELFSKDEPKDGSSPGSSVTSSPSPPVASQQSPKTRHRHHHHHHHEHADGTHPRRHSHKPSQQVQVKKPPPRANTAVNALSDTELEYQTPRTTATTQESEWSWGWGSLPVKNDGLGTGEAGHKEHPSSHLSIDIPGPRKPVLNEMDIDGTLYKLAISLCPGDEFGKDLEASEALFAANQVSFDEFAKDPLKVLNNKNLVCLINDRYRMTMTFMYAT